MGQVDIFVRSLDQTDLWPHAPPVGEALDLIDIFVRSLGQADLWSDVPPPPVSEASGLVDIFVRSLCQTDLWSDISPKGEALVRLTFLSGLWVRMTFSQMHPM